MYLIYLYNELVHKLSSVNSQRNFHTKINIHCISGVRNSVEINHNLHTFTHLGCARDNYYLHFTQTEVKEIIILYLLCTMYIY